jgi:hypothetical protein
LAFPVNHRSSAGSKSASPIAAVAPDLAGDSSWPSRFDHQQPGHKAASPGAPIPASTPDQAHAQRW